MNIAMFSQIAQITDHLYLSSAFPVKADRLRSYGITHVINITLDFANLVDPNIESVQIRVDDAPHANLYVYFDRLADKIHNVHMRRGRTLVHCIAGVSRSATICMVYLMKYQRMTLEQAYHHVKKRRPVIRPNVGFWRQLVDYERRILGRNSVQMVQSGIGLIPDVYKDEARNMVWISPSEPPARNRYVRSHYDFT
ncbi:hypothetical protein FSP39_012707 [Pinctada imbricata]|uniref:protein-serine/threonine phosphatase n=1 Tax=Pinctada imbricata TaxID=66713 RepID=A0AA88Y4C6_PINIB|nr:hypothetical protein FSP39_012707 [Pinctada imbricata]